MILTLPWLGLQVVQEIKMLRGSITQREKEKAERATLVQQERLIKSGVSLRSHVHGDKLYC